MNQNKLSYKSLPIFVILCALAMGFGGLFMPGPWYESLQKAPWTPPNIAFPIVWSILYIFIAIRGCKHDLVMGLFWSALGVNWPN